MADETTTTVETQQPDPVAIEAEARRGGWRPKEEFQGDPTQWVDSSTFVARGKEILPKVQRHAARLEQENNAIKGQLATTQSEVETLRQQVQGLTQFQQDMDKQGRERIRASILEEIRTARANNDVQGEMAAIDKLTSQPAPRAEPTRAAPAAAAPARQPTQIPQEMTDWTAANPWYQRDPVMQGAMNIVGAELRASGQLVGMTLTEQLNATARVVQQRYMPPPANGGARVEGGARPAGDSPGAQRPQQTGYEALPPHIKAECDAQGERLGLVGKGKTFETKDAWRTHYAAQYQRYEPTVGYDYRPPGN